MDSRSFFSNQPKIFPAIAAGFRSLSKNIYLLAFPILLDLFLLVSPKLTIKSLIKPILSVVTFPPNAGEELLAAWSEFLELAEVYLTHLSITSAIRTLPIGVPSLLSGRVLTSSPLINLRLIELNSWLTLLITVFGFSLLGIGLGFLFHSLISSTVVEVIRKFNASDIRKAFFSTLLIPVILFLIFLLLIVPVSVFIVALNLISPFLGMLGYVLLAMGLITVLLPLVFTPQAIFLFHQNIFEALMTSMRIVRSSYSRTSLFFGVIIAISYFSDILWQSPPDNSWMLIVGIIGHALTSSVLLIASYHFFMDAAQKAQSDYLPVIKA